MSQEFDDIFEPVFEIRKLQKRKRIEKVGKVGVSGGAMSYLLEAFDREEKTREALNVVMDSLDRDLDQEPRMIVKVELVAELIRRLRDDPKTVTAAITQQTKARAAGLFDVEPTDEKDAALERFAAMDLDD